MAINDPLDLLASKGFTAGIFGKHPNASNNEKPIGKLKTKKREAHLAKVRSYLQTGWSFYRILHETHTLSVKSEHMRWKRRLLWSTHFAIFSSSLLSFWCVYYLRPKHVSIWNWNVAHLIRIQELSRIPNANLNGFCASWLTCKTLYDYGTWKDRFQIDEKKERERERDAADRNHVWLVDLVDVDHRYGRPVFGNGRLEPSIKCDDAVRNRDRLQWCRLVAAERQLHRRAITTRVECQPKKGKTMTTAPKHFPILMTRVSSQKNI